MAGSAVAPQEYWGYLIKADNTPTPIFEQLLLGVANYIVSACSQSPTAPIAVCENED